MRLLLTNHFQHVDVVFCWKFIIDGVSQRSILGCLFSTNYLIAAYVASHVCKWFALWYFYFLVISDDTDWALLYTATYYLNFKLIVYYSAFTKWLGLAYKWLIDCIFSISLSHQGPARKPKLIDSSFVLIYPSVR